MSRANREKFAQAACHTEGDGGCTSIGKGFL